MVNKVSFGPQVKTLETKKPTREFAAVLPVTWLRAVAVQVAASPTGTIAGQILATFRQPLGLHRNRVGAKYAKW